MVDDTEYIFHMSSPLDTSAAEAAAVPLPDSPNDSLVELAPMQAAPSSEVVSVSNTLPSTPQMAVIEGDVLKIETPSAVTGDVLQSPARKTHTMPESKPMSPEKAALAAMFDSIKMPPPVSPSKSPRKTSGSNILSSPSKQVAREAAPAAISLFRKSSSPSTSPSKVDSTDSAASRHDSKDSPLRRPVVISSSSSPGKRLHAADGETKNASTPLSPGPATSSSASRPPRMRPSMLASSSSPSARLSDLSLNLDTTGTQELFFNQDTSFLAAAANTAADVTIDDSFDVSRARARIQSASNSAATSSAITRRSSPAKLGAYRAKPRCSVVPEEGGMAEFKPRSPGKARGNALGLRGLGIGRVVKNAAGDDTIELNLTGSFIGNSSMIGGNLMDESGEASLLFGNNSFSITHSGLQNKVVDKMEKVEEKAKAGAGGRNSSDEDEDFERDAQGVQKWAAEAARKAQLERQIATKTPVRSVGVAGTPVTSAVTQPASGSSTITKPVSRIAPRPSLVTPTAGSRLLKPRACAVPSASKPAVDRAAGLVRSGSASAGLASLSSPAAKATTSTSAASTQASSEETGSELKTPMRSRRKSTFTSSRPPVSGPARRRESLAASAAATLQTHPIPPLPPLGPATPGRSRTASAPSAAAGISPNTKTPTAAARSIPKPRSSLTGRTAGVLPTPRTSTAAAGVGAIPRPRPSLASSTTTAATPSTRSTLSSSSVGASKTPGPRTSTIRSASLATPTARAATSRNSSVEATPVSGMRKSASQPHGLDLAEVGETPTSNGVTPRARTLVPRASMSRLSTGPAIGASRASQLVTPRMALQRPSARADTLLERSANSALVTPTAVSKVRSGPKVGLASTGRSSISARSTVAGGGFGFKPRTSAVYVGPTRSSMLDDDDKEN